MGIECAFNAQYRQGFSVLPLETFLTVDISASSYLAKIKYSKISIIPRRKMFQFTSSFIWLKSHPDTCWACQAEQEMLIVLSCLFLCVGSLEVVLATRWAVAGWWLLNGLQGLGFTWSLCSESNLSLPSLPVCSFCLSWVYLSWSSLYLGLGFTSNPCSDPAEWMEWSISRTPPFWQYRQRGRILQSRKC